MKIVRDVHLGRLRLHMGWQVRESAAAEAQTVTIESTESSPGIDALTPAQVRRRISDFTSLLDEVVPVRFDNDQGAAASDFGHLDGWYRVARASAVHDEWQGAGHVSQVRWVAELHRVGAPADVLQSVRLTPADRLDFVSPPAVERWIGTPGSVAMVDDTSGTGIEVRTVATETGDVRVWQSITGSLLAGWADYWAAPDVHYHGSPRLFDGDGLEIGGQVGPLDTAAGWTIDNGEMRLEVVPNPATTGGMFKRWRWVSGSGWLTDGDAWRVGIDDPAVWVEPGHIYQTHVLRRSVDEVTVRMRFATPVASASLPSAVAGIIDVTCRRGGKAMTLTVQNRAGLEMEVAIVDAHAGGTYDSGNAMLVCGSDSPTVADRWMILSDHVLTTTSTSVKMGTATMARPRAVGIGRSMNPGTAPYLDVAAQIAQYWRGQPALSHRVITSGP